MEAMQDYKRLLSAVDQRCDYILGRYGDQIVCASGCPGNCCRIHLSIAAVEAFHLASALKSQPREFLRQIRKRAVESTPSDPCPLLDRAACRMYPDRLILCRTHGLPMRTQYRGRISVGCCQKNFTQTAIIPADACIDLDPLNKRLAEVNQRFLTEYRGPNAVKERYLIGEALTRIRE